MGGPLGQRGTSNQGRSGAKLVGPLARGEWIVVGTPGSTLSVRIFYVCERRACFGHFFSRLFLGLRFLYVFFTFVKAKGPEPTFPLFPSKT